jgi:hypothetical protein
MILAGSAQLQRAPDPDRADDPAPIPRIGLTEQQIAAARRAIRAKRVFEFVTGREDFADPDPDDDDWELRCVQCGRQKRCWGHTKCYRCLQAVFHERSRKGHQTRRAARIRRSMARRINHREEELN